ncbi:sortase family protein [Jatrophihabitans sp. GAS493]|uniref:sortase domain-bontaining protein n=1 Tax=Jatrophihabitans sp. GAS493 TaxID=1907575 RepID=UPI000BB982EF|nr:sortase [Jatrophihabitans sp. GAS493]SOD74811.1 sortase family protein [Jatrophihabitans sp. GAS493]
MRKTLLAITVTALLAVAGVAYARHSSTSQAAGSRPSAASVAPQLPVKALLAQHAGLPRPTPTPRPPHDVVPSAVPTSFEIAGPAFDVKAKVCQMPYIRPLDPPGDQRHTVCWVKSDFGVAPGSNSGGTSYILGHSWSKAPLVFNPLSELAMKQVPTVKPLLQNGIPTYPVTSMNGYRITLKTTTGTLTYQVTRAFAVSKEQAGNVKSLMANTPNRVVLITCAVNGGVDADYNIVVDAYLSSSKVD